MHVPPSPFWSFSLAIYRKPGVAEACLALQDRHGLDVNLMLAALFAGTVGIALDADAWALLESTVGAYHREVVQPLRAARRALKPLAADSPAAAQLRGAVKAAELDAEHLEQLMIAAALAGLPETRSDPGLARANVFAGMAACGVAPDATDRAAIERLLAAIPPSG